MLRFISLPICLITFFISQAYGSFEDPAVHGNYICDLSAQVDTFPNQIELWRGEGLVTPGVLIRNCGSQPYLGGMYMTNIGGYYERTYTGLPPHEIIYYLIKTTTINQWNVGESFSIYFDDKPVVPGWDPGIDSSLFTNQVCEGGGKDNDYFETVGRFFHNSSSLTVRFRSDITPTTGGVGFRLFHMIVGWKKPEDIEKSCGATRFSDRMTGSYLCGCLMKEYKGADGNCYPCATGCRQCFGPTTEECYAYSDGRGYDGSNMFFCASGCTKCFGTSSTECSSCSAGLFLFRDYTCQSPCSPPYVSRNVGYDVCETVCQVNNDSFMLWDGSCSSTCESPLTQRIEIGSAKFCDHNCNAPTAFLRWDGVCTSTCELPATIITIAGKQICKHPCADYTDFIYTKDNSCRPGCKYPYKIVTTGNAIRYCVLDISEEEAEQAKQVSSISSVATDATNMGGTIIAMLTYNNPALMMMGSMTEMLQYIQYLRIDYPPKLYLMLEEQNINSGGLNILTEIPEGVEEAFPNRPLPEEFQKNDTGSSYVANVWGFLISLSSVILAIGITLILKACTPKLSKANSFLGVILRSLKWNLFLGMFCSGYGFTGLFTALEFRTVNMDSGLSILSFVVSLIMNCIGFFILFLIVQLSITFGTIRKTVKSPEERAKHLEEAEEKWKSCEVLFEDYKNDHFSQKMYPFVFMLRTYIHYAILGYLNDYPLVQTIGFTVTSIAMISYMIIRRPIKGKINFAQQMLCEIAILIVNACVAIMAAQERWDSENTDIKVKPGDVIIIINLVLSFASSLFLAIEIFGQLKTFYSYIKKWSQSLRKAKAIKQLKVQKVRYKNHPKLNNNQSEISELRQSHEISVDELRPYSFG